MAKLKRSAEPSTKPSKKRTVEASNGVSKESINQLVEGILESPAHYNDIINLIDLIKGSDVSSSTLEQAEVGLAKVFGTLSKSSALRRSADSGDAHNKVAVWLNERYADFKSTLVDIVRTSNSSQAIMSTVTVLVQLLSIESKYMAPSTSQEYYYPKKLMAQIVESVVLYNDAIGMAQDPILHNLITAYLSTYDDLRYYFYREVAGIFDESESKSDTADTKETPQLSKKAVSRRLGSILQLLAATSPKTEEELVSFYFPHTESLSKKAATKSGSPAKLSSHKIAFQKAWIAALQLPHTLDEHKVILKMLHQRVIPNFHKPQMLMDFLTDCYDHGGSVSLLALNSLFMLMQSHNLDYPNFYTKLYALFDGTVMHTAYRSRFFRLVDLFLSSSHLPATIAASFIKKMARLALYAPPGAVVATVPFIYNQLKRHPTCMKMIQNADVISDYKDPFDPSESDPLLTQAIDSSLWELETLQSHYHPNVATLAKIMSQPFRKPQYGLEDFLDQSYQTLMAAEESRKIKVTPSLEFEEFPSVLGTDSSYLAGWTL